jgi:hypothetical protein
MDVDKLLSNHSREDRGPAVLGGCIIGIICCVLAVAVRLKAQASIRRLWTGDSILIVCAAILSLAVAACTIAAQKNGLGRHEVSVMPKKEPSIIPPLMRAKVLGHEGRSASARENGIHLRGTISSSYSLID